MAALAMPELVSVRPPRPSRREALTTSRILAWAEGHHARTGSWPTQYSGEVADAPGETWSALDVALRFSARGLPGGDSLARLLRREGRIGERRGRRPKISRNMVERLRARGMSLAEIGRFMGVSRQAVWEMVKKSSAIGGML